MVTHEATAIVLGPSQATQEKRAATITIIWVATFSLWNNGGPLVSVSHWVIFLYLLYYKLGQSSRTTKNHKEWRTTHKGRSSRLPSSVCTTDLQNLNASHCLSMDWLSHSLPWHVFCTARLTQLTSRVACMFLPYEPHRLPGMTFHLRVQKLFKNPRSVPLRTNPAAPFAPASLRFLTVLFLVSGVFLLSSESELLNCRGSFLLPMKKIHTMLSIFMGNWYISMVWGFKVLFSLRTVCEK